ncbi:chitobiase/beta-hexosaminidase C-terminal domain-containing protein [Agathobacter ruminis]|uniref:Cell surface protein n=1 Tax=Agathobacter ruminis TaxID=1712665 RepID=A0A2G3E5K3_9FIRM|nr:chitobiase/beta-hexosaminidase C-terminal domain-containing protein [Agathobacter ruminis]MDC7302511.1 chitobiase/beta-hexosaminidase C-terminal domain-containing protein [Agathobacter ruminis]PHU38562.1 cell surface protein [Agathobacter ruminis]
MKCSHCGATIEEGKVYCSKCGKEIQMVPDYNAFEEDLLTQIFAEENAQKLSEQNQSDKKRDLRKQEQMKKKKLYLIAGISIAVILILICIVLIVAANRNKNANSYDYQYKKGVLAVADKDYKSAIEYLERATVLDEDDLDSRLLLLECYQAIGDENAIIVLCHEIINIDSSCKQAYEALIDIYDKNGDVDSIVKLSESAKDDNIMALFDAYIVTSPLFSVEAGTYDTVQELQLTSSKDNDIFYTLDGSDPKSGGYKYSGSILLENMGSYTIKAVCKNAKGLYSEVVEKNYILELKAPDKPVVTLLYADADGNITEQSRIEITVPENCSAYYSWDESTPDPSSADKYYNPISIPEGNNILTVIIVDEKTKLESDIYRGNFVYQQQNE